MTDSSHDVKTNERMMTLPVSYVMRVVTCVLCYMQQKKHVFTEKLTVNKIMVNRILAYFIGVHIITYIRESEASHRLICN